MIKFIFIVSLIFSSAQASYLDLYLENEDAALLSENTIIFDRIDTRDFDTLSTDGTLSLEQKRALFNDAGFDFAAGKQTEFFDAGPYIKSQYQEELDVLSFEKLLLRITEQKPLLSDEDESNSPFDLVRDLNLIDQILFGENAERTEPSFTELDSGLVVEESKWQIGDPRTVDEDAGIESSASGQPSDKFQNNSVSISAALEDIMDHLIELNSPPLNLEYATNRFFQPGISIASIAQRINLVAQTFISPGAPLDTPEVRTVADLDVANLAFKLFGRFVTEESLDYYSQLDTQVAAGRSTEIQQAVRELLVRESEIGIQRGVEIFSQQQKTYAQDRSLEALWQHLESTRDSVETFKNSLERISERPDR